MLAHYYRTLPIVDDICATGQPYHTQLAAIGFLHGASAPHSPLGNKPAQSFRQATRPGWHCSAHVNRLTTI